MKKWMALLLVAAMALTMVLSVSAEYATWTDEETEISYLQIFNCDEVPTGSNKYAVDTENAQEGSGCLTWAVGTGAANVMTPPETIDGTDYDTLEFDLYVSDVTLFDLFAQGGMNSGFELTSSGVCDYQEISWRLAEIKSFHAGEEIVEGWNHIILPLSTGVPREAGTNADLAHLSGPFDISGINYVRFFMVNEKSDTGITIKLDNICLSDRQAVEEAAAKEAANKAAADNVIEKINELPEITAENYTTAKLQVSGCRSTYDKLSDEAKAYISEELLGKLTAAETAIADFEANPPKTEDENEGDGSEKNPTDDDGDQTGENDAGCASTIALGGAAMMVMVLSLGAISLKKREG